MLKIWLALVAGSILLISIHYQSLTDTEPIDTIDEIISCSHPDSEPTINLTTSNNILTSSTYKEQKTSPLKNP